MNNIIKLTDNNVYRDKCDRLRTFILRMPPNRMQERWKFLADNTNDLNFLRKLMKMVDTKDEILQ